MRNSAAASHSIHFKKIQGIPVGKLASIEQFASFVVEFGAKETALYRGQRTDRPLLPRIARIKLPLLRIGDKKSKEAKVRLAAERSVFEAFKREAVPYLPLEPTTPWRWLTIARHHELPTRLLDWSENPLIALWFAVSKPAKGKEPGVVWQYNPDGKDFIDDTSSDKNPFALRKAVVLRPSHTDDRIRVQASIFTVHSYAVRGGKIIPFENLKHNKRRLRKLLIEPEDFPYLRFRLDQLGINEAVIYRDLTGLCHRIDWNNSFYEDEEGKFEWNSRKEEWMMLPQPRAASKRATKMSHRPKR
jgi:hypothetical protein